MNSEIVKTRHHTEWLKIQSNRRKTLKSQFNFIVYSAGLLILGVIGSFLGRHLVNSTEPGDANYRLTHIIAGVFIIATFLAFGALIYFTIMSFRPKRKIICPRCGKRYYLFKNVKTFCCDKCLLPMFFNSTEPILQIYKCPYCQISFGANKDYGQIRCLNCGAHINIEKGMVNYSDKSTPQTTCNTCDSKIPAGGFGCFNCGALTSEKEPTLPESFDDSISPIAYTQSINDQSLQSMLTRDSKGLMLYVDRCLLQLLGLIEDHSCYNQKAAFFFLRIETLNRLMTILNNISIPVTENFLDHIIRSARKIDHIYSFILMRTFNCVSKDPEYNFDDRVVHYFETAPQVTLHKNLIKVISDLKDKLQRHDLEFDPKPWKNPLLMYMSERNEEKRNISADIVASGISSKTIYKFKDPSPLRKEAIRINPEIEEEIKKFQNDKNRIPDEPIEPIDWKSRKDEIKKQANANTLLEVIEKSDDIELLKEIAIQETSIFSSSALAVKKITDRDILAEIATTAKNFSAREQAVKQLDPLKDEQLLQNIIEKDDDGWVRKAAKKKLKEIG